MTNKVWTAQELEILLKHNHLSTQELAAQLPGRTLGAVEAQREVIL